MVITESLNKSPFIIKLFLLNCLQLHTPLNKHKLEEFEYFALWNFIGPMNPNYMIWKFPFLDNHVYKLLACMHTKTIDLL